MRRTLPLAAIGVLACAAPAAPQAVEKELVVSITGPPIERGVVSEVLWDGGTLIIQSAVLERDGQLSPRYFAAPGPRMELRRLRGAPAGVERYWRMKASRLSPTGFGPITAHTDAKVPMFGIASLEKRMQDAVEMGGTIVTHELRLGDLLLHSRRVVEPYDGEVWSWSPPELNRIAYVDGKGDLWVARATGANPERLLRGEFTLPAWSEDGRLLAVAERREGGKRWDISVVHVAERFLK